MSNVGFEALGTYKDFDGKFNVLAEVFLLTHVLVLVEQKQMEFFASKLLYIESNLRSQSISGIGTNCSAQSKALKTFRPPAR